MMSDDEREQWEVVARGLEETGEYRVIRRYHTVDHYTEPDSAPTQLGLIVDTETTGIDWQKDKVIELGLVLFEYAPETGRIYRIVEKFDQLQDPGRPIPSEITALTHITDEMVHGQHIDEGTVQSLVARSSLIIAHNAAFDRPFVEQMWPAFQEKPWACTMSQIHWYDEGIATQKQELIALSTGFFYDAHRAGNDCLALLHILARVLPVSAVPALKPLLSHAMTDDAHIWAIGAPFETKDALRMRGYRFNNGTNGRPKAWHRTVSADEKEEELVFLESLYPSARSTARIDVTSPFDRFSVRA
jgi:DNA polymerase-3 subunit epsilon